MLKPMRLIAGLVLLALAGTPLAQSQAQPVTTTQQLVDKAKLSAERMLADPKLVSLNQWMKSAKGVVIIPSFLKAGFVVGAAGGNGVLLSRDASGRWSAPAFYTIGEGSIGLQAGVQDAEVMLVIMTDKGLNAIVNSEVKLGADASLAVGEVGVGLEGATTTGLGKDILSYSKTVGLYGGVSVEGAWIKSREAFNSEYYGKGATPSTIVLTRKYENSGANELRAALSRIPASAPAQAPAQTPSQAPAVQRAPMPAVQTEPLR